MLQPMLNDYTRVGKAGLTRGAPTLYTSSTPFAVETHAGSEIATGIQQYHREFPIFSACARCPPTDTQTLEATYRLKVKHLIATETLSEK